jgi:opacity protein-like surface antigen
MLKSKLFLIALISLLSIASMNAQSDSSMCSKNFEFMFINGYSVAYSKDITSCSVLRYKLDLDFNWNKDNGDINRETSTITSDQSSNSTVDYSLDEKSDNEEINFTVQYLWMYELGNKVELFAGAGPTVGYSRNHYNDIYDYTNSGVNPYKNEEDYTRSAFIVGLYGSCGVQCDVTENLSIIAEYDLVLEHLWQNTESVGTYSSQEIQTMQKSKTDSKTWDFTLSSIKLGVGFRF